MVLKFFLRISIYKTTGLVIQEINIMGEEEKNVLE